MKLKQNLKSVYLAVVEIVGLAILLIGRMECQSATTVESVVLGADSNLKLPARFYRPSDQGPGPFPAVVVMHGSGGLWQNDDPVAGVLSKHFQEYAALLGQSGIASLFVDSYTPRGLVEFGSRRPAQDPAVDDSACSPAYGRPRDAYKALEFLQARPEIRSDRIGLMGFSQGAESVLSAMISPTISRTNWTMSYLLTNGTTVTSNFPAPYKPAASAATFRVAVAYYPGCGFYNYFGSPSSTNANLYMPYAPILMHHGSADPLYSGNLYPERMVAKSLSQSIATSLGYNPMKLIVYAGAAHSFDEANLETVPPVESPDQTAKRSARERTMAWFEIFLKDFRVELRVASGSRQLAWKTISGVDYRVEQSPDLINWSLVTTQKSEVTGSELSFDLSALPLAQVAFLRVRPVLVPLF